MQGLLIRRTMTVSAAAVFRIRLHHDSRSSLRCRRRGAAAGDDLPEAKPEEVGISSERLHRIDDVIRRYIDEKKISGAVTLVARRGRVVHYEAQGVMDVESEEADAQGRDLPHGLLDQAGHGRRHPDADRGGEGRPDRPRLEVHPRVQGDEGRRREGRSEVQLVPAEREVTIRDLMTHTSGLASGGLGQRQAPPELLRPGGAGARWPRVRAAASPTLPLDFQPGTRWRYSGLAGIDTLARVVEVASGPAVRRVPQAADLRAAGDGRHLLRRARRSAGPPGDRSTAGPRTAWRRSRHSSGSPRPITRARAASSSTAADYFRFAQMLANGGELGGHRLLSPRAVELYGVEPRRRPVRRPGSGGPRGWASA